MVKRASCGREYMLMLLALVVSCQSKANQHRAVAPPSVAGAWVRVYPPKGALDTLVLAPSGSLSGSTAGLDSVPFEQVTWQLGAPAMPTGLCFAEPRDKGPHVICQGYLVRGDTLWLANQRHTVFLRLGAASARDLKPWTSPRGNVIAPHFGDPSAQQ